MVLSIVYGPKTYAKLNALETFSRHAGAVRKYCEPLDHWCRKKQRQALLHWAYDSRKI
ncbi:MAG: hypothetical protein ACI9D5_001966 [Candidatus Endobugula sp.]|jgi:hypothetical protein